MFTLKKRTILQLIAFSEEGSPRRWENSIPDSGFGHSKTAAHSERFFYWNTFF